MRATVDDIDHRDVRDRDGLCFAGTPVARSGRIQQRNRDSDANYLVRLTRQVPVCGAFDCDPRVV